MGSEIIKVLDALCDKVGIVIDWTSENILPQLEELSCKLVSYELWTSVFWRVMGGLLTIASLVLFVIGVHSSVVKNQLHYEEVDAALIVY